MRIVVVQCSAQWTGAIEEQIFLDVPANVNLQKEEKAWFAAGGGTPRDFVNALIAKCGATQLSVEIWDINYM